MELSPRDRALLAAMADGMALESAPYAAIGRDLGMAEAEVLERLGAMLSAGIIRRFGVVVRHHELGYRANAMIAWQVPDAAIDAAGRVLATQPGVTLCYRRAPSPPDWPYALFCMIHGRDRAAVLVQADAAARSAGLADMPRAVLFSGRRFQQRGARFATSEEGAAWTRSTGAS